MAREPELTREQTLKPNLNLWCRLWYIRVHFFFSVCELWKHQPHQPCFRFLLFFCFSCRSSVFCRLMQHVWLDAVAVVMFCSSTWSRTESVYVFFKQISFDFIYFFLYNFRSFFFILPPTLLRSQMQLLTCIFVSQALEHTDISTRYTCTV